MAIKKKTDLSAALTGLILGVVSLFLLLTSIVMMTNAHYRGKEAAETPTFTGSVGTPHQ